MVTHSIIHHSSLMCHDWGSMDWIRNPHQPAMLDPRSKARTQPVWGANRPIHRNYIVARVFVSFGGQNFRSSNSNSKSKFLSCVFSIHPNPTNRNDVAQAKWQDRGSPQPLQGGRRRRRGSPEERGPHGRDPQEQARRELAEEAPRGPPSSAAVPHPSSHFHRRQKGASIVIRARSPSVDFGFLWFWCLIMWFDRGYVRAWFRRVFWILGYWNCFDGHPCMLLQLESLPSMVAGVWSDESSLQLEATTQFRKLLSIGNCGF